MLPPFPTYPDAPNAQFSRRAGHAGATLPQAEMAGPVGCNASDGPARPR
jgi:hypothetical protein